MSGERLKFMKALSLVKPSGTRIASGEKTLEVRRWKPSLRADEYLLIVENNRFLRNEGDEDDEGRVVAMVRVATVRPFVPEDMVAACGSYFEDGWLAWELVDVRPLFSTINVKAARGIYELHPPHDIHRSSKSPG
jgi:hypothetical protein